MKTENPIETQRLEFFSDAVFAIVLTIMVLEFKTPHEETVEALIPLIPVFLSYILSFIYIGIYWNNHHHLVRTTDNVRPGIMWNNLHLLFWLSLIPFTTGWVGEHAHGAWPAATYGFVLLMAAFAYFMLQNCIVTDLGKSSPLAKALGSDYKGKLSPVLYATAIGFAFVEPWISYGLYSLVALMWIVPDRRIEKLLRSAGGK